MTGHTDIEQSQPVNSGAQRPNTIPKNIVGHNRAPVSKGLGHQRGLVAGGCAQIQNAFPGLRIQQQSRYHRAGLLDMKPAGQIGPVAAQALVSVLATDPVGLRMPVELGKSIAVRFENIDQLQAILAEAKAIAAKERRA